jgi:hypothetical protein
MYHPFFAEDKHDPELLMAGDDSFEDTGSPENDIIEERDGIHYISDSAFVRNADTEKVLNSEFKKLVDSVVK